MNKILLLIMILSALTNCNVDHKISLTNADTDLCNGLDQCIVKTQQDVSSDVETFYFLFESRAYLLKNCDSEGAIQLFSGSSTYDIKTVSPSNIEAFSPDEQAFISCTTDSGQELDPKFNTFVPIFRMTDSQTYYVPYNNAYYYELDVLSCGAILEAWQVTSDRFFVDVTSPPSNGEIIPLTCELAAGLPTEPNPDIEEGWKFYQIASFCDIGQFPNWDCPYFESPVPSTVPVIIAGLYTWPSGETAALIISKMRYSDIDYKVSELFSSTDYSLQLQNTLNLLVQQFDLGDVSEIEFLSDADNLYFELVERLVFAPAIHLDGDSLEAITTDEGFFNITLSTSPSLDYADVSYPLALKSQDINRMAFANGDASTVARKEVDIGDMEYIWGTLPEYNSIEVVYLFASCSEEQNPLENIVLGDFLIDNGTTDFIENALLERSLARDLRGELFTDLRYGNQEIYRKIIKYPCLHKKPSCELEINSKAAMKAVLSGEGLDQCDEDANELVLNLKTNLEFSSSDFIDMNNNSLAPVLSQNIWSQREAPIKKITINGNDHVWSNSCQDCLVDQIGSCTGSYIPSLLVRDMESVTLQNLKVITVSTSYDYLQDGISIEDSSVTLNKVTIGSGSEQEVKYQRALCSANSKVYVRNSQFEGEEQGIYLTSSFISVSTDFIETDHPNLYPISDSFAYFGQGYYQERTKLTNIKSLSATGSAIKARRSSAFLELSQLSTIDDALTIDNSNILGYGLDLKGPMLNPETDDFDSNLEGGVSKGLYLAGKTGGDVQFQFSSISGFRTAIYFPYGLPVEGVNNVRIYESILNPQSNNLILSNIDSPNRIGSLDCTGNCY